jgi:Sec-independent protein translocase protein TatA
VASEMGKGIKAFKDGLNEDKSEDDESEEKSETETKQ